MKKTATVVPQPDKTETVQSITFSAQPHNQKMYRDKIHHDHVHGRVNKFPIGSNNGPIFF